MKKSVKKFGTAIVAICMCGAAFGMFAGCADKNTVFKPATYEPTDKEYLPSFGFVAPTHAVDSGMKIDGVLDETVYTADGRRWYNGMKVDGEERAKVDVTTVFGQEGIYIAYDVEELTNKIYYNPDRASWLNSGVEMYFALGGATSIDSPDAFEIDMECSGKLYFKRRFMENWVDVATTYDVTPIYAATTKGGNYNTDACYGYSGELFIPFDFLVKIGALSENEKPDEVYINPVLITSYSEEGTDRGDRNWHNLAAADTDGDGWANPSTFLHFDENGLVAFDIETNVTGGGSVTTPKGYDFALADNSLTLDLDADNGCTLESIKINNIDYKDKITYKNYKAQIVLPTVSEDIEIKADFKQVSVTPRLVRGNIVPQGVESSKGITDMTVKYFDGFNYGDLSTINGAFAGYVPEGKCELVVASKSGNFDVARIPIEVTENMPTVTVEVDDTMYGDKSTVRLADIALPIGGKTETINNPIVSEKFVFAFRLGVMQGAFPADKYVENLRLIADNGDYITIQLVRWGGNFATKVFLRGQADQDLGGLSSDVTEAAVQNGYLDFVLVRNKDVLTVNAYGLDGTLKVLGTAQLKDAVRGTSIVSYRLEGAEGVTAEIGMSLKNCVVYQGTTDLSVLNIGG